MLISAKTIEVHLSNIIDRYLDQFDKMLIQEIAVATEQ